MVSCLFNNTRWSQGLIGDLEQEITELQRRNKDLEHLSCTEDHIHFLQVGIISCIPFIANAQQNIFAWYPSIIRMSTHFRVQILQKYGTQIYCILSVPRFFHISWSRVSQPCAALQTLRTGLGPGFTLKCVLGSSEEQCQNWKKHWLKKFRNWWTLVGF